jgi:Acetyltransferase (GNAT) domain
VSTAEAMTPPELAGVRVVSPAPRDVWRRVLAADPDAVATQTPEWMDCLGAVRGYVDASRLYELPNGRTLVLPLAGRVWAGVRVAEESWPYGCGYGGVLAPGERLTARDATIVLADLARRPLIRAGVVPMPLTSPAWQAAAPPAVRRVPYLTQILDLEGGFDTVWRRRYRSEVRRHVRRAGRMSLDVHRDPGHGVDAFTVLYRDSIDRWARQRGQPRWAAQALARRRHYVDHLAAAVAALGKACTVWSAYRAGEPIAASVVLHRGRHAVGWLSANNRELAHQTGATYLLSSLAIEAACAAGARYFHMGESDPGSGVQRHKAQFGAIAMEYQALRFERLPMTRGAESLAALAAKVSSLRRERRPMCGTS